jgi:hypothetical protein
MSTGPAAPIEVVPHPHEHSRLLIALSASAIFFGCLAIVVVAGAGWLGLLGLSGSLLAFAALIWILLQVHRARLLGHAVKVSEESLPALEEALDEVRHRLGYHRRIDVYVAESASPPASMTSYLGVKIILFEGGLIADLLKPENRPQLTFLLARHVGAMKARHRRLTVVLVLLEAVRAVQFLFPFLFPYYRATTYAGDQLGQACCGDVEAALEATGRLLVGKEMEPELRSRGVVRQARRVRHEILPRLAQLSQAEPHLTNRYLNVLFYSRRCQPEAWERLRGTIDADTARELERLWARSPHSRPAPSRGRRAATSGLAVLVSGAALLLFALAAFDEARDDAALASTPSATAVATETPTPVATETSQDGGLDAHVPAAFRDSCRATDAGDLALAAVDCTPLADDAPAIVRYYGYADTAAMDTDFGGYAAALTPSACPGQQETWAAGGSSGRVACYTDDIGSHYVVWTDESLDILGYAETILSGPRQLFSWWSEDGGPV